MKQRADIQALRGWAVLLVVLDHARLDVVPAGYLGVDIFFVISGFLITGIISRSVEAGTFSFSDFYLRRARRILPAAYATLILTALGAIWFLTSLEFADLRSQILGALTFTINFVLLQQVDYFANEATTKPLLHMWSLAIEEQFYLLLPALMVMTPRQYWRPALLVLLSASLVGCLALSVNNPSEAFYLLPTRAWELLLGSALAVFATSWARHQRAWRFWFWPALSGLAVIPCVEFGMPHPGLQALAICLCAAIVLLARRDGLGHSLGTSALARLGDISYALYLVHWPVAVFVFSSYLAEPTLTVKLVVIAVSLACAIAMYFFVEQPARHRLFQVADWRAPAAAVGGALAVIAAYGTAAAATRNDARFIELRKINLGLDAACNFAKESFSPLPVCATSDNPDTLLWGDSYAMHLADGLQASKVKFLQATQSECAPLANMAPQNWRRGVSEQRSRDCIGFNADVLLYAIATPSIRNIILASPWATTSGFEIFTLTNGGQPKVRRSEIEGSLQALASIVTPLKAAGKNVLIVEPPPTIGVDLSRCIERSLTGKIAVSPPPRCALDKAETQLVMRSQLEFVRQAEKKLGVRILRLADVLCISGYCETMAHGLPIYRDKGHLSREGSKIVFSRIKMSDYLKQVGEPLQQSLR